MSKAKRFIAILFAFLLCFSALTGCDIRNEENNFNLELVAICGEYDVYCDTETKVLYATFDGIGVTPLYNADGSLRLYSGD